MGAIYQFKPREYICRHCGCGFMGRKRKYCGDACATLAKAERDRDRKKLIRDSGRPFRSIRRPNPVIDGKRQCLDCERTLPLSSYEVRQDPKCKSGHTIRGICKGCAKKAARNKAKSRTPEQRRKERARRAEKLGKSYTPAGSRLRVHPARSVVDQLAKKNARQAWDYWVKTLASDQWVAAYYESMGLPWRNPRLGKTDKYRIRYAIDPSFAIKERIRRQVTKAAKRDGVADLVRSALRRGGKSPMAEKMLGYSVEELHTHLERQFTKGMNWDLFMAGEIHIDHIVPQSEFDLRNESHWRKCWCLSNLRPMWGRDNVRKQAKRLYLL